MPFFYDLNFSLTANVAEATQMWGHTIANQETVGIYGLYAASRFGTAGGAQLRLKHNTGTTASGGTAQVPAPKNLRGNPAAQSVWANATTTITAGSALVQRMTVGFAQTGGMGGFMPIVQTAAHQMMPNTTNPIDAEITALATSASVTADMTLEIGEGI